jgi:hypothetical protein
MSNQNKKKVTVTDNTSTREIPNRADIVGSTLQQNPQTGQIYQVPVTEGNVRMYYNQNPYERWNATQEARQEASLTSRERGYKRLDEVRPLNKAKQYNPVTGKWQGGKTKKHTSRKSRKTKSKGKRTTRRH